MVAVLNEALLQGILQLWLRQRVALHVGTVQGLRCGSLRRRMLGGAEQAYYHQAFKFPAAARPVHVMFP
jgi:hypothetical protein